MPVHYDFNTRNINDILTDESIQIPEHQRPEMWKEKRQSGLINTIMSGLPMPNITLREEIVDNKRIRWLEDGQQRFISIKKFYENKLQWNTTHYYKDLTEEQKRKFQIYKICILTYDNASQDETIHIFDSFQNGVALTPGQRFHARLETPLVKYARDRLLTPEKHFHQRAVSVWGPHRFSDDTKTKKILVNAMAIAGGVAHGVEHITTSYDILGPKLIETFDVTFADSILDKLLSVFEGADAIHAITIADKKKQWDAGKITGYILYSLLQFPDSHEDIIDGWIGYLVSLRNGTSSLSILHTNMPPSRNWNSNRWRIGYENVFEGLPDVIETNEARYDTSDSE
jgi:hypothetical protein